MKIVRFKQFVVAGLAGIVAVGGFAPWNIFPLPLISLALLFWLWEQAEGSRTSFWLGFSFGLGFFGAGVGWLYVALHEFGNMDVWLALLAMFLFASFIAMFPALAGLIQSKLKNAAWIKLSVLMPALWVMVELLRGYLFTGFPWLTMGYSQVPNSPLAGFAPIVGVYGVSLVIAISAGLIVLILKERLRLIGKVSATILILFWLSGAGLHLVKWTTPEGDTVKISLLQGNINEEEKFEETHLNETMQLYQRMAVQSDARLIVFPETALPILRNEIPKNYISALKEYLKQHNADVLIGSFEKEKGRYYNSMYSEGVSPSQNYRKNHLVPFGEFIPMRWMLGWFINNVLNIPMSDLSSGGEHQALLNLAGQRIAMNICYEDVFGEEIIRALPEATLLLNTSNDAWYGHSSAAIQHNQISQMRALESGRMMLRATNTGVTSVIDRDGQILDMLPQHTEGVLTANVQGYTGSTPYVRWGNAPVLGMIGLMLGVARRLRRR